MKYLISIGGPTAIGKTKLAIALAQYFKTEIISADSRQFFKEMKIGTAVPTDEELQQAPHHFIQHKSIFENYSVGDFERETIKLIDNLFKINNIVVMVGGSGLYSNAVINGLDDFPEIPPQIRNTLNTDFQNFGISFLQQKLQQIDPEQYNRMDNQNPQRLIRALEVCLASGKPYSSFLNQTSKKRNFIPIEIALKADREIVYQRINQRVELMLHNGLLCEAQKLYPHKYLNALQTVGYRELFDFFNRKTNLREAIENIKMNTRRFAKRQFTWFNKNKNIQWFDYQEDINEIITYINHKICQ